MSRKLTNRQFKRIKKELDSDYLKEKEQRKRKRDQKLSRTKGDRRKPRLENIEDLLEEDLLEDSEWADDR